MEILEQREQWQERFHSGWLAHYQQTVALPWERHIVRRSSDGY